ncbi:S-adenosylmethionine-dependent methyltransferase Ecym_4233 [Eremothecium cymbalariae DBVPG|uniref:Ribosomal lysine N-methyltransferase 5 n=1 Tax=Eremothecium cymbalariae (strain CBS 270.75 / DBVPG 7215 / KCTC 17166 / NRRL Y-17582) TaxID=931890 RepID=G8JTE7_ERECY|nr:hypothetical protein Ecym_4233 [Eremothecium cymbalariae DBVPG\
MRLRTLHKTSVYEHVFERYMELQHNADRLDQDLGIQSRRSINLEVDISPVDDTKADTFNLSVSQSLTSLNSNNVNNNSTTGYVLWSSTPYFLKCLLYNDDAAQLRKGGNVPLLEDCHRNEILLPAMFSSGDHISCIVELGAGISGIMAIVMANYVDKYVATDQKAILKKLQENLQENINEVQKRSVNSNTLPTISRTKKTSSSACNIEVLNLDWETFCKPQTTVNPFLAPPKNTSQVYIVALDVIYNEFLISPFLQTLKRLLQWYVHENGVTAAALVVVQLRAQDVLQSFLEQSLTEHQLKCYHIELDQLLNSRFAAYYITL